MSDTRVPNAHITNDAIYLDGVQIPGLIEQGSVIVKPTGFKDINRVTVTFMVSEVQIDGICDE